MLLVSPKISPLRRESRHVDGLKMKCLPLAFKIRKELQERMFILLWFLV